MSRKTLVTGAAGFIGYHTAERLLARGERVIGLDNLNEYYDVRLKHVHLARLQSCDGFSFRRAELADRTAIERVFAEGRPDVVIHLVAQAGVRYSLTNPHVYGDSNLTGSSTSSMGAGSTGSLTSCTRRPAACTARTPRCRFPRCRWPTIQSLSTPRPRGRTR